jgi:hypothetical protein
VAILATLSEVDVLIPIFQNLALEYSSFSYGHFPSPVPEAQGHCQQLDSLFTLLVFFTFTFVALMALVALILGR